MLVGEYEAKVVKSVIWKDIGKEREGYGWMQQNVTSQQVARVLRIQEQTVPTRGLAKIRGKHPVEEKCRLCMKEKEGVKHWLCGCEYLAGREYLKRHDQTLRVLYAEILKMYGLEDRRKAWFNTRIETVRENERVVIVWNKRMETHTKVSHRWPDLRVEDKKEKVMWIMDMSCPGDSNVKEKEIEKRNNYLDLMYEMRIQRPNWRIRTVPLVVGAMGAIHNLKGEVEQILGEGPSTTRCVEEMQKVTVLGSLQLIHRIESGLV